MGFINANEGTRGLQTDMQAQVRAEVQSAKLWQNEL